MRPFSDQCFKTPGLSKFSISVLFIKEKLVFLRKIKTKIWNKTTKYEPLFGNVYEITNINTVLSPLIIHDDITIIYCVKKTLIKKETSTLLEPSLVNILIWRIQVYTTKWTQYFFHYHGGSESYCSKINLVNLGSCLLYFDHFWS